jgi:hypothetical protein
VATDDRRDAIEAEKSKALVRALHRSELEAAGARRAVALHAAEVELDRIGRRLPDALQAGLTISEIGRITGVSRPTLYELRGRHGSVSDLRLAVLQATAFGAVTASQLARAFGRPEQEVSGLLSGFFKEDWVDIEHREYLDNGEEDVAFTLTAEGATTLENWTFEDD